MVSKMVQLKKSVKKHETIATGPVCPWKLSHNCHIGGLGDCTMSLPNTVYAK